MKRKCMPTFSSNLLSSLRTLYPSTLPMRWRSSTCLRTNWTWLRPMQRLCPLLRLERSHTHTHTDYTLHHPHTFFVHKCLLMLNCKFMAVNTTHQFVVVLFCFWSAPHVTNFDRFEPIVFQNSVYVVGLCVWSDKAQQRICYSISYFYWLSSV